MKVFGVGLQRTGTTSLTDALAILGIKTLQYPKQIYRDLADPIVDEYDGFTDNPVPLLFRELDERFPGSKFILTIRDEESWLESLKWLFRVGKVKFNWADLELVDEFHHRLYGRTTFDRETFRRVFRSHNDAVRVYFASRPDDLLEVDVERGDGFEKLAPFLGREIPRGVPFPHRNKSESFLKVKAAKLYYKLRAKAAPRS